MEAVLHEIKKGNCSFDGLLDALQMSKDYLETLLNDMECSFLIRRTKDGKYRIVNFKVGRVIKDNNKLYVLIGQDKYLIDKNSIDLVKENYNVSVDINTHNKTCTIINILEKNVLVSTGEVITIDGKNYICEEKRYVLVDGYIEGQIISYEKEKINGTYYAKNIKVVGYKDDPDIIVKEIAARLKVTIPFPEEVLEEVKSIKKSVDANDIKGRVDLRNLTTFTIDCNGSKDFDDAMSIEKISNGNYKVYVHIAHVAHYVKRGTALDKEASKRSTSFYPGMFVIPMLPEELSNGICSLNPNVDRLTKTHEFEITKDGNLINYKKYDSVINSNMRMKYDEVNKLFKGENIYKEYETELNDLRYLYLKLRQKRKSNKYIEFNIDEYEAIYEDNDIVDIKTRNREDAEKLIEEFMLLTGKCNAHEISKDMEYRVHPEPNNSRMTKLVKSIEKIEGKNLNFKDSTISELANLLEKIDGLKNAKVYNQLILMRMASARFSPVKDIHYALHFDYTCQVTSPIRRYTDLINQRIDDGEFYSINELQIIGKYASMQEKKSKDLEAQVLSVNMARYVDSIENKQYNGFVLGTEDNKLKIQFYKGIVGLMDLQGKIKVVNDFEFVTKNKKYILGEQVNIEVVDCDLKKGIVKVKKI